MILNSLKSKYQLTKKFYNFDHVNTRIEILLKTSNFNKSESRKIRIFQWNLIKKIKFSETKFKNIKYK